MKKRESKPRRMCLGSLFLESVHQAITSCSCNVIKCCSWNLSRQEDQTWRLKTQPNTI
jgi:hypothetical protein